MKPDFDHALYVVSDCLSEAHWASAREERRRAAALFCAAERYAARTGYVELMNLVWAYEGAQPTAGRRSGQTGGDGSVPGSIPPLSLD